MTAKYTNTLDIDDPLRVQQGENTFYYHKDGLGSVVNLTDASGSAVKSYTYKSFGEIFSESGTLAQPFTFTGREYDPESGLYFYRARYYDPRAGRFLTKDPIGFAGGDVNLYRYVWNSPTNWIDPTGEWIQFAPYLQRLAPYAERAFRLIQRGAAGGLDFINRSAANAWASLANYIPSVPRAEQTLAGQASNAPRIVRGFGNITQNCGLKPENALSAAERWLGSGYREIKPGVFRSADNLRQFRMVGSDLIGSHGKIGPHIHFEALNQLGIVIENLHVPLLP